MKPRNLILAATPRSGSYLFCDIINQTGVAGNAFEFACSGDVKLWMHELKFPNYDAYKAAIISLYSTTNDALAIKFMWFQFSEFLAHVRSSNNDDGLAGLWQKLLEEESEFIHLRRTDRIDQAISWAIAYNGSTVGSKKLGSSELLGAFDFLEREYQGWENFFRDGPFRNRTIYYEEWTSDIQKTISEINSSYGLEIPLKAVESLRSRNVRSDHHFEYREMLLNALSIRPSRGIGSELSERV